MLVSGTVPGLLASANEFAGPVLFPFAPWWPFYAAFTLFVLAVLALDLGVFHRQAHEVSHREAVAWTVVWAALAAAFGAGFWWWLHWKLPQLGDDALVAAGYEVVGAATRGGRPELSRSSARPLALVLGNEEHGLDPAVAAACSRLVTLPGAGRVESLNVSVAAGILIWEAWARRG